MAVGTYRIKVVHGDQQFEVEGDKKFVLEMLKRFGPDGPPASSQRGVTSPIKKSKGEASESAAIPSRALSVGEFVRQAGLKRHTDLVLGFGYYLEKHSDLKDFTPADINTCYYEAKIESSNTSQMIAQNIKRSYMMPARGPAKKKGGARRYTLTRSGLTFIESKLSPKSE